MDWKKYWLTLQRYFFMKPTLELLSQGMVFKQTYGIILKILAILTGIGGLILWIFGWKGIFSLTSYGGNQIGVIIGGIIIEILMIVFFYILVHTFFIRATDIEQLPETGYPIIPIISISLKLVGELWACALAFLGIAGAIFAWLSGSTLDNLFQGMYYSFPSLGGSGFGGGLMSLILGEVGAFLILMLFYFLSESTIVVVDIANSLKSKK